MKKLVVVALFLNAVLLAGRFWQELPVDAQGGGQRDCGTTQNGDVNGDQTRDISDVISLASWLFLGGSNPVCCAAQECTLCLTSEEKEILGHMSIVQLDNGQGGTAKTVRFSGVNVQIVDGRGNTAGPTEDPANGLGNLIVGYNELRDAPGEENNRTGSHNVVIGIGHNYSDVGGLVIGLSNTISGRFCFAAGHQNTAGASFSSVSGGEGNRASGDGSSVSGGINNTASGRYASVSGGGNPGEYGNEASGDYSSITGGFQNRATEVASSVMGGRLNVASGGISSVSGGYGNTASGTAASVSGGRDNKAEGLESSVTGGSNNLAAAWRSSVTGGSENSTIGERSAIAGGKSNTAVGAASAVSGGYGRTVTEEHNWRAGSLFQEE